MYKHLNPMCFNLNVSCCLFESSRADLICNLQYLLTYKHKSKYLTNIHFAPTAHDFFKLAAT